MHSIGWILLFSAAVCVAYAGFCTENYACTSRRTCTGRWFNRRCKPALCTRNVCCPGWGGVTCTVDIEECKEGHHGCSDGCTNTVGSYICTCPAGTILDSDRKTCVGHWCDYTHSCYKTCNGKDCTKRWWKTTCHDYTYQCPGVCTAKKCCVGWTGSNCHLPGLRSMEPSRWETSALTHNTVKSK